MGNEISVEMRLKLEKLKQDAARAGKDISSGLASSVKGLKGDSEIAEENKLHREKIARARRNAALDAADMQREMKKAAEETRKQAIAAQNELDAQVEAAARRNRARRLLRQRAEERANQPMQGPDLSGSMRNSAAEAAARAAKSGAMDKAAFNRNIGFALMPMMNPTSMLGNFASLRQSYKAFSTTQTGQAMVGRMGLGAGAGGAMAAAALVTGAAIGVGLALKGLQKAIQESLAAIERARVIYAKTLSSGMGTGMTVKRAILSQVIGVSEDELFTFGKQIEYVNERLTTAIRTLQETQPRLAATAINAKIMGENFHAMWAKVAEAMAPALNRLYTLISALVKLATLSGVASLLGKVIGGLIDAFARFIAFAEILPAAMMTAFTAILDGIKWMVAKIHNYFADSWIGKKTGMQHEAVPDFKNTKEAFAAFKDVLRAAISVPSNFDQKAPTPIGYMKQLPASAWEKMGLVVGGGGGTNYNMKIADNTKKGTDYLRIIAQAIMRNKNPNGGLQTTIPSLA